MPIVPMSKVEVSSPLESSSIADLNDKERKRKQFAEFMAWVRYMVISSTLTIAFGAMWVDMTHKKLKKQQGFEVYRIFLVCYLFGLVAYNIRQCPNKEAIWKIGLGVERDDDDEEKIRVINIKERYIMFRSPGTSFFLACFSSNLVWVFFLALNEVAEMLIEIEPKNNPGFAFFSWLIDPWAYTLLITTCLSMAVVCFCRTFNLLKKLQPAAV